MKMIRRILTASLIAGAVYTGHALAQVPDGGALLSSTDSGKRFAGLRKQRADLEYKLTQLQANSPILKSKIEDARSKAEEATKDLDNFEELIPEDEMRVSADRIANQIKEGNATLSTRNFIQRRLDILQKCLKDYKKCQEDNKSHRDSLLQKKNDADKNVSVAETNFASLMDDIATTRKLIPDTEDEITTTLNNFDTIGGFKLKMSLVFAGLVFLVITGFFIVALRDRGVSSTIFSNDSGIQFITLFSLVIAIILFGIIGILESKELATLLGGLSGYILGRTTNARTTPAPGGV